MTGHEIRETLIHAGVVPNRQLGQNFLVDPNCARWIVSNLEITPDDAVVEVGPGTGALTEHLVGQVRRLILIEFDAKLAAMLKARYADLKKASADRCPRALGTFVKAQEVQFHHEVYNQFLWNMF